MTTDRHWSFSVPVGVVSLLVAAWGLLDLLGTFDDAADSVVGQTTLRQLLPRLGEVLASVVVFIVLLRLAVSGVLPKQMLTMAVLAPVAFMWVVVAVYRTGRELGVWDEVDGRTLLKRHGFWLILLVVVLYLPMLGSYSLTDPWETHYGEVSRELLARNDWISTWWAQDGFFYSKPIFDFWIQALSFSLLGVRYMPDKMLSAAGHGFFPQPEWANRMPIFILTLLGVYALYKALAKVFGRRAGFLAGVVLTTMPLWYLLAHQTMCDMPYVGPLTASMALLLLGFHTDPEARAKQYEVAFGSRTLRFSGYHLLFALVVVTVLPQVLYLLSRNVTLQIAASPHGFRLHPDEFFAGSGGGNCGLPGNQPCREMPPFDLGFQPWKGAALWSVVLGVLLWINRGERRRQRLYFLAAWFFMAISALAKGAPGLVLPLFVAGVYIGALRRWKDFSRLELIGAVAPVHLRVRALVRADVRAPRHAVHRRAAVLRHVQARVRARARHERGRRRELPLLHLAARLLAVPLGGARRGWPALGVPSQERPARRAWRRGDLPHDVVHRRLRHDDGDAHEVSLLHLPGRPGDRRAHRRHARPRLRRARSGRAEARRLPRRHRSRHVRAGLRRDALVPRRRERLDHAGEQAAATFPRPGHRVRAARHRPRLRCGALLRPARADERARSGHVRKAAQRLRHARVRRDGRLLGDRRRADGQ